MGPRQHFSTSPRAKEWNMATSQTLSYGKLPIVLMCGCVAYMRRG